MFVRDFFVGGTPWGGAIFWLRRARGMVLRRAINDCPYGGWVATFPSRCGLWQLPQPLGSSLAREPGTAKFM